MQNFSNNDYSSNSLNSSNNISFYHQLPDPSQNEPFNKATHQSNKAIISKHIFAVDSRQRNFKQFPDANSYSIEIPERYRNVTSIELKAAMLPRTEYNVNGSNKYMDISVGDFLYSIKTFGDTTLKLSSDFKSSVTFPLNSKVSCFAN